MQELHTFEGYLYSRWLAEDDDGFNLVIIDARREGIAACVQARLANTAPADRTETGGALYERGTLDAAFQACFVPEPSESE
mgnify:CR=1 FL=1|jgi:hypothetical protein